MYDESLTTKNVSMVQVSEDLVDAIWTSPSRAPLTSNPLIVHPVEFTGESVALWTYRWHAESTHRQIKSTTLKSRAGNDGHLVEWIRQTSAIWLRCWRVGYRCRRLRFTVGDLGRGDLTCYQSVHWHSAPVVDPYSLYGSTTGAGYAIVTDIGLRLNLQWLKLPSAD